MKPRNRGCYRGPRYRARSFKIEGTFLPRLFEMFTEAQNRRIQLINEMIDFNAIRPGGAVNLTSHMNVPIARKQMITVKMGNDDEEFYRAIGSQDDYYVTSEPNPHPMLPHPWPGER